ncbi:hypothetical protein L1049_016776 [Liquidambar formosana]|uniref:Uncharacterized protein n=1 Tax=Liquidambar formosana TaxID=63359 RepID=A0AAP0X7R2_LIQFO
MATKATDSSTVTTVHRTSSTNDKSNQSKLCELHPVVKYEKPRYGHRKIDSGSEKSNSGHRNAEGAHRLDIPSLLWLLCVCVIFLLVSRLFYH